MMFPMSPSKWARSASHICPLGQFVALCPAELHSVQYLNPLRKALPEHFAVVCWALLQSAQFDAFGLGRGNGLNFLLSLLLPGLLALPDLSNLPFFWSRKLRGSSPWSMSILTNHLGAKCGRFFQHCCPPCFLPQSLHLSWSSFRLPEPVRVLRKSSCAAYAAVSPLAALAWMMFL